MVNKAKANYDTILFTCCEHYAGWLKLDRILLCLFNVFFQRHLTYNSNFPDDVVSKNALYSKNKATLEGRQIGHHKNCF